MGRRMMERGGICEQQERMRVGEEVQILKEEL